MYFCISILCTPSLATSIIRITTACIIIVIIINEIPYYYCQYYYKYNTSGTDRSDRYDSVSQVMLQVQPYVLAILRAYFLCGDTDIICITIIIIYGFLIVVHVHRSC